MTESEWLACTDPQKMLEFLRGKASDRKLRLFAVACCRLVLKQMSDERCRVAAEIAERFADGMATEQELRAAADAAFKSADDNGVGAGGQSFAVEQGIYFAARTASYAASTNAYEAAVSAARTLYIAAVGATGDPDVNMTGRTAAGDAVVNHRRKLLDDIFANPFRPVVLHPGSLTPGVVELTRTIYDQRAFDRLPILADALGEAGCTDADILNHCRGVGPHVRGCWVIDLLLGRE